MVPAQGPRKRIGRLEVKRLSRGEKTEIRLKKDTGIESNTIHTISPPPCL